MGDRFIHKNSGDQFKLEQRMKEQVTTVLELL